MRTFRIGCVVEGHGEMAALPRLLPRLGRHIDPEALVTVGGKPFRLPRGKLCIPAELERAVDAVKQRGQAVLVLADADDDCPAEFAPALLAQVEALLPPGQPCAVVLASREFESWFLAAAPSLADGAVIPSDANTRRDAKGWVAVNVCGGHYHETADQPRLTARMDLALARANSPSFDKLCRDLDSLLCALRA